jgi:hypothetical protein
MVGDQDHNRPRWNAGLAIALLACIGLLLQGVLRLTHHHDVAGQTSLACQDKAKAAQSGGHDDKSHDDEACTTCVSLAMTSGAAPMALPLILKPAEIQHQRAQDFARVAADVLPAAPWRSRAPPAA